jgi:release factor glutamine methyltransferase
MSTRRNNSQRWALPDFPIMALTHKKPAEQPVTIRSALHIAEQLLPQQYASARIDAEVLLAHAIMQDRVYLHTWPERTLTTGQRHRYSNLIKRRAAGEPVAYLTGRREFWSLSLGVSPATLIPRPETELLVEQSLRHIPSDADYHIADLGTGCGAIALAIASERPSSLVTATDIDTRTLDVARSNARHLQIHNVKFLPGSWCDPLRNQRFHIIISNPPYIRTGDPCLTQGDLCCEPLHALIAGKEGMDAIRIIVSEAKMYLQDQGWLLVEHGYEQQERVLALFRQHGYTHVEGATDMAGHGRMVMGRHDSTPV